MINFFLLEIITVIARFVIDYFGGLIAESFYNVVDSGGNSSNSGGSSSDRGDIAIS